MSNIYLSSGAFQTRSVHELMRLAQEYDITHLELSSGMSYAPDFLQPIRDAADKLTYLVHNYFPPPEKPFVLNLAATDAKTSRRSKQMVRDNLDLCVELGAPFYSVHSGFSVQMRPEDLGKPEVQQQIAAQQSINYEAAYSIFRGSVAELANYAQSHGIGILLENNVITPENVMLNGEPTLLMGRADEYERLLADVDNQALGILVDTGHLMVAAETFGFDRVDFIRKLAPHIRSFHLSDNDSRRDSNQPITPDSWFLPVLADFPTVPMVVEAYNLSPQQMHEQIKLVQQARFI